MGLTYTSAAQRDVQRTQRRTQDRAERFRPARLSLAVTSGVALLAITLAYLGRVSLLEQSESARASVPPVNLNAVVDSGRLEPALETVFSNRTTGGWRHRSCCGSWSKSGTRDARCHMSARLRARTSRL